MTKVIGPRLLSAVDLAGTFLLAVEGATAAITGHLDLLGIMVLSFATALAGGVIRDLLIGAVPPEAFRDWRYSVVAFAAAGFVFMLHHSVQQVPGTLLMVLDAAGLGLFAVAGTEKSLAYGIHPFIAILMGTITGVGGGMVRDILLAQVPGVLRTEVYATAAFAGSAVLILCRKLKLLPTVSAVAGGIVCFALRVVSVLQHWNLPRVMEP
ncbi:MAG TPA: trimeric intracellular cation channel family protein [Candidatus Limnocylindrales bacterium]|nr:trimeric intracellular cation channel family protein [Candidatus Limnocylindrales bacterium]